MEACKYCGQQHIYTCPMIEKINTDEYGNVLHASFRSPEDYDRMKMILDNYVGAEKTEPRQPEHPVRDFIINKIRQIPDASLDQAGLVMVSLMGGTVTVRFDKECLVASTHMTMQGDIGA